MKNKCFCIKYRAFWFALKVTIRTIPVNFKIHYTRFVMTDSPKWIVPANSSMNVKYYRGDHDY